MSHTIEKKVEQSITFPVIDKNQEYRPIYIENYEDCKIQVGNFVQIPLHRITDSASNGSVFPVVTEHFSASSDHAFL